MMYAVTPFSPPDNHTLGRRRFLRLGTLTMIAGLTPHLALANTQGPARFERSLDLYNTHTGESLCLPYWADGHYIPEVLNQYNYLLRDHHTDEVITIDLQLLDLLHTIGEITEMHQTVNIISAYRSHATNARLRERGAGAARNSLHIPGKAVDIRTPGHHLKLVRRVALALELGGVGYYPRANFLHIDTGPARSWVR
jgi:uncharacterized protein YcbK (DUF882 family)